LERFGVHSVKRQNVTYRCYYNMSVYRLACVRWRSSKGNLMTTATLSLTWPRYVL